MNKRKLLCNNLLCDEYRENIVEDYKYVPVKELAALYRVSPATIRRIAKKGRETGTVGIAPKPGRPSRLSGLDDELLIWINEDRSITLDTVRARLIEYNLAISLAAISRHLKRLGLTKKKGKWRKFDVHKKEKAKIRAKERAKAEHDYYQGIADDCFYNE